MSRFIERDPELRRLYLTNAWFKAAVDTVVPLILQGLAAVAEEKDRELREAAEKLKRMPPMMMAFDPEDWPGSL